MFSGSWRTDAGRSYPYFRGNGYRRRCMWWYLWSIQRLCDARRPWDGEPFWMSVGSLPQYPFHWDTGRFRTRRILLAEQRRSELLFMPCNRKPRRRCTYGRQIQLKPERLHGDHETFHDQRRGSVWQDDRGCLWRRSIWFYLLAVLENHVCIWKLAQRIGDETLFPEIHPSYRRPAGFQCTEIYQIQSVWITDPANAEISGGSRGWFPV